MEGTFSGEKTAVDDAYTLTFAARARQGSLWAGFRGKRFIHAHRTRGYVFFLVSKKTKSNHKRDDDVAKDDYSVDDDDDVST